MGGNQVLIFPQRRLQAWDKLPRFTFLEADLGKCSKPEVQKNERMH